MTWHNNSFPFLIAKWSHPSPVDFLLTFSEPVGTPACTAVHAASAALVTGCKAVWYGVAWLAGEAVHGTGQLLEVLLVQ